MQVFVLTNLLITELLTSYVHKNGILEFGQNVIHTEIGVNMQFVSLKSHS